MILVFGTICIDRIRRVSRLPGPGGYVEMLDDQAMLGGEAANTALALKTWGSDIELAGNSLGDGPDGKLLQEMLVEADLPVTLLEVGGADAPVCDIYVTPDGERTMFGKGFSTMTESIATSSLPFKTGQWFTAEPNMLEAARRAARLAAGAGMNVYLMDLVGEDEPIPSGGYWQSSTDWAGRRGDLSGNIEWLKRWVDRYGCFGILSDGPNGFVAGSVQYGVKGYPPFPPPAVVDTTGAGDFFRAGMLMGLDNGWEVARCLQFASAAGCLKCQGLGATGYVPSVEEIEAHIRSHPSIAGQY